MHIASDCIADPCDTRVGGVQRCRYIITAAGWQMRSDMLDIVKNPELKARRDRADSYLSKIEGSEKVLFGKVYAFDPNDKYTAIVECIINSGGRLSISSTVVDCILCRDQTPENSIVMFYSIGSGRDVDGAIREYGIAVGNGDLSNGGVDFGELFNELHEKAKKKPDSREGKGIFRRLLGL